MKNTGMKKLLAMALCSAIVAGMTVPVYAATELYQLSMSDKGVLTILADGKKVDTLSTNGKSLTLGGSGTKLTIGYSTVGGSSRTASYEVSDKLSIEGNLPALKVADTYDAVTEIELPLKSNITTISTQGPVLMTISGKVGTLSLREEADVMVLKGGYITQVTINDSDTQFSAASTSTVKRVDTVKGPAISGSGIKACYVDGKQTAAQAVAGSKSSSGNSAGTKPASAKTAVPAGGTGATSIAIDVEPIRVSDSKATLDDLADLLAENAEAFNIKNQKVYGTFYWVAEPETPVVSGKTYRFEFAPKESSKYDCVRSSVRVYLSSSSGSSTSNKSSGSSAASGELTMKATQIDDVTKNTRLSTLSKQLTAHVKAYNSKGSAVAGRVAWVDTGTTMVAGSGSYQYVFTPTSSSYPKTTGSIRIALAGDEAFANAPGGVAESSLAVDRETIYASAGDRLSDLEEDLEDAVAAYDIKNRRVAGSLKWLAADADPQVISGKSYRFEFIPDSSKYDRVRSSVKVIVQ